MKTVKLATQQPSNHWGLGERYRAAHPKVPSLMTRHYYHKAAPCESPIPRSDCLILSLLHGESSLPQVVTEKLMAII